MDNLATYKAEDKMIDLISNDYSLLQAMSRFGLSLGFGEQTVREVCEQNGVDCDTFLAIVNFMVEGGVHLGNYSDDISLPDLIEYLCQAHQYYLDFCFPDIRRKLVEAIDCQHDEVGFLILQFFDEYTAEVRKHMEFEEKKVYPYVKALLSEHSETSYPITTYSKYHLQVAEKLAELKNILIKYCPQKTNATLLNAALFDIYACEEGLDLHGRVEDYILVPAILKLERRRIEHENK